MSIEQQQLSNWTITSTLQGQTVYLLGVTPPGWFWYLVESGGGRGWTVVVFRTLTLVGNLLSLSFFLFPAVPYRFACGPRLWPWSRPPHKNRASVLNIFEARWSVRRPGVYMCKINAQYFSHVVTCLQRFVPFLSATATGASQDHSKKR